MKMWTAEIVATNNRWGLQLRYDGHEISPQVLAGILNDYERKTEAYGFINDDFEEQADRLLIRKKELEAENDELKADNEKLVNGMHEIYIECTNRKCDDDKKRVIEAERKVANLHKVISKQQLKIQRQAENISTLLHLYTSGERSQAHKRLREKYKCLKKTYRILQEQK